MQQVNLYLPELRPKQEFLTANVFVVAILAFILLMVLLSIAGNLELKKLNQQVINLENRKVATEATITKIKNVPKVSDEIQINRRLDVLRKTIENRRQVGAIIESENLGNEKGFSSAMNGMASQSNNNIALERIKLSQGGKRLELKGHTRAPENVPLYLKNLEALDAFDGVNFGGLSVLGESNKSLQLFSLGFEPVYVSGSDQ